MLITSPAADRTKNPGQDRLPAKFWLILFLLCLAITAILFGWTLSSAYFFSDDFTWLWHGSKINLDLYRVLTFRMSSFYSPVLNLFYSAMLKIFSFFAPAYFAFGLLVHLANSLLAAVIAWQLTRSRPITAAAALLFAAAGGAFEPLVWIGANMHSIAALFIFLGLSGYLAYLNGGKNIYLFFSFLAALLAIGSKEIAAIFPLLLWAVLLIYRPKQKNKIFAKAHLLYWSCLIILFFFYGLQQYLWQKQSLAVASGNFAFSWHTVAKIPIILADLFVPLGGITPGLHRLGVGLLITACAAFTAGIFYFFRKLALIRFGFIWMLITIAPTIMLATADWWDPLASRYTYLPRFGMILVLAAIWSYYREKKSSRAVLTAVAAVIIIFSGLQIFYMVTVVNRDYPYVYNTGRSLAAAMNKIKTAAPARLYIRYDHPFANNNAHLVGAAVTIAGLEENAVSFPDATAKIRLQPGEILLYWDANARQYKLKNSAE